jgi:hypothetical protein
VRACVRVSVCEGALCPCACCGRHHGGRARRRRRTSGAAAALKRPCPCWHLGGAPARRPCGPAACARTHPHEELKHRAQRRGGLQPGAWFCGRLAPGAVLRGCSGGGRARVCETFACNRPPPRQAAAAAVPAPAPGPAAAEQAAACQKRRCAQTRADPRLPARAWLPTPTPRSTACVDSTPRMYELRPWAACQAMKAG